MKEAQNRSTKILDAAERVIDRSYQGNLQAAREGAAKAVAGLQNEVRQAANRMRLEALKGSRHLARRRPLNRPTGGRIVVHSLSISKVVQS